MRTRRALVKVHRSSVGVFEKMHAGRAPPTSGMKHALNTALALFFASFVAPSVVLALDELEPVGDASTLYFGSLVLVLVVAYVVFWLTPPPGGSLYDVALLAPFVYLPVVAAFSGGDEPVYRVALALAGVIAFVPALGATAVGARLNSRLSRVGRGESVEWYARRSGRRRGWMRGAGAWAVFGGFVAVAAFGRLYASTGTVTPGGVAFATPLFVVGFGLFALSYTSGIHRADETGFVVEYPARSRFYEWDDVEEVVVDGESNSMYVNCGLVGVSCDTGDFDTEGVVKGLEEWVEVVEE